MYYVMHEFTSPACEEGPMPTHLQTGTNESSDLSSITVTSKRSIIHFGEAQETNHDIRQS